MIMELVFTRTDYDISKIDAEYVTSYSNVFTYEQLDRKGMLLKEWQTNNPEDAFALLNDLDIEIQKSIDVMGFPVRV